MAVRTPSPFVVRTAAAAVLAGGMLAAGGAPALAAGPAAPAPHSALAPAPTTVTVTGDGQSSAAPDIAVLHIGVESTAKTAQQALAAQNRAADAMLAAVRKAGVADKDVRTESLNVSAVTQHEPNGASKVTGYQAGQVFSVKVREIEKTGSVLQSVMDAAGDAGRIHSVAFDVADTGKLRERARTAAHMDARAKAEQYAKLSGMRLGRLVSVNEGDSGVPRPVALPAVQFDKEGVPVAPGEIEDRITVTEVYELR
ncbi:SIMPL domain-containing protein [Streptomyces sp. TRM66268-LWL]|uniref:SIMPL domain-containing protein n=1 Tax=Streptomyces polyasparticus TaxID=2767826 RepID=A0ABR7SDU8_9ACTN|nr:SIMPL domain-containing protein [Streptomyces polyasparticus]MBC9713677.1 SIMPL domain-containing protein [Streptomyces polyasparticus]